MKLIANLAAIDERARSEYGISGLTLMEEAGRHVAQFVSRLALGASETRPVVTVVCGKGNNAGDGFVCARYLVQTGQYEVHVVMTHPASELRGDALENWKRLSLERLSVLSMEQHAAVSALLQRSDWLVDALFGTGLTRPMTRVEHNVMMWMNASPARCVAIDVPSGVNSATGALFGGAVQADYTVTFAAPKPGLYLYPGKGCAGTVSVVDIGIPESLLSEDPSSQFLLTKPWVRAQLPKRHGLSHKYTYGSVLVIAGSRDMPGAAVMTAHAALRAGAGVVRLAAPQSALARMALPPEILSLPLPESETGALTPKAMGVLSPFLSQATVVAVGPGLSNQPEVVAFVETLLISLLAQPNTSVVLDADALNALAAMTSQPRLSSRFILTPHVGEAARLLNQPKSDLERDLLGACASLSQRYQATVVLKSATTLVSSRSGQLWFNPTGNPGMATAGSGDILTGLIAGFYAQGVSPDVAACVGTYLHGLAGDKAAQHLTMYCLMATDILHFLPEALQDVMVN